MATGDHIRQQRSREWNDLDCLTEEIQWWSFQVYGLGKRGFLTTHKIQYMNSPKALWWKINPDGKRSS